MRGVQQSKGLHVLQRLLGPLLALYILRRRARAEAAREASLYHAPGVDALRALPLFEKWQDTALLEWVSRGATVAHKKGTCIGFSHEPPNAARVYWVLCGKVAQVPTKSELRKCAGELPPKTAKTGPAVLPSHFLDGAAKAALPPPTPTQERIIDSLALYHAGHLVDAERLLLGGGRQRSLRCQTDCVLLSFSFVSFLRAVQGLPSLVRSHTIDVARAVVQRAMAQLAEMPTAHSLTAVNPILWGLPQSAWKTLRLQLRPSIFLKLDVLCHDVANSDRVHFLSRGQVLVEDGIGGSTTITSKTYAAIGLESFLRSRLPDYYDQKLRAKAATYCETWSITTEALLAVCDAATRLRCAQAAAELLGRSTGQLAPASALRTCPCFADVSEAAIAVVARALHPRVYCAGDTIVPARRSPNTGILLVAGAAAVHSGKRKPPQLLRTGEARYFCESLVRMELAESIVAQSSALVLHGAPATIFELLEETSTAVDDMQVMLAAAQEYVNGRYGAGASDLSKAQNAAAERVKAFKRRQAESAQAAPSPPPPPSSSGVGEVITALENELLVSLTLQLQSLHPDGVEDAKFDVFRAVPPVSANGSDGSDGIDKPRHVAEYFSLDDQGNLITTASTDAAPTLPTPPVVASPLATARSAGDAAPLAHPPVGQRKGPATAAPARAPAPPRALRTSVRPPAPAPPRQGRAPSPRLTALRGTATRLREEVDGVDRRVEYRRRLTRVKHSLS
ncbi:hypothetical protein NESM_000534900 [Novymonas esmeraldas]|uniref:Cyclic nucleotide-binding domain-containing protein n=1 Tax=Novymonas esmeraldas TaxID=1808958 RepID=A0AAW0EPC7_9TRYP